MYPSKEGSYTQPNKENKQIVKIINEMEYKEDIIRLGTGELSPEFMPKEMVKKIFSNISEDINELNYNICNH